MKNTFPRESLINVSLLCAIASLAGIGLLYILPMDQQLKQLAYYVFLSLLLASAIAYSLISVKKGIWLYQKIRERRKQKKSS